VILTLSGILDFFSPSTKIEKEKREHAKQHGMIRTEITGAEIAEEMEKERRLFQLQMCEVSEFVCLRVDGIICAHTFSLMLCFSFSLFLQSL
jgi:hypothetical protein